jgi:hypothetical protein
VAAVVLLIAQKAAAPMNPAKTETKTHFSDPGAIIILRSNLIAPYGALTLKIKAKSPGNPAFFPPLNTRYGGSWAAGEGVGNLGLDPSRSEHIGIPQVKKRIILWLPQNFFLTLL